FSRIKRAKISVREIKEFLKKHTKNNNIKIDNSVNELIWERGIKNPPGKIRLKVIKVDDVIWAYTPEAEIKIEEIKKEKKEEIKEKTETEEKKEETHSHAEKD
ncbi:MAG: 50S ribosomal protein L31e, partial [Candidatus Thermoplasmatota archaeon]